MTTLVQPMSGARTGLVLAWSVTVMAIVAIGLVVVAAPMPHLSAASASGTATSASAGGPAGHQLPLELPVQQRDRQPAAAGGLDA